MKRKPRDLSKLSDKEITEKAIEARREYMRKYRQRPEVKKRNIDYQKKYWARQALKAEAEAAANGK